MPSRPLILMTSLALVGAVILAACSSVEPDTIESEAPVVAKPSETADASPMPPTPVPVVEEPEEPEEPEESEGALFAGSGSYEWDNGYQMQVDFESSAPLVTNVTESPVIGRSDVTTMVDATATVTNTTPGSTDARSLTFEFERLILWAALPLSSPVCGIVSPGLGDSAFLETSNYCLFEIAQLPLAEASIPPSDSITVTPGSDGMTAVARDGYRVEDGQAETLETELSNPFGMVLSLGDMEGLGATPMSCDEILAFTSNELHQEICAD